MEVRAIAKHVRVQPRKVRIVADEVRGKSATYSAAQLRFHTSKGAKELRKVLMSAMANAAENHGLSPEQLQIAEIRVDEGPRLKRIKARAMGRANRIVKKSSHITVVVEDVDPTAVVKPHGTKAKPRPTLSAPTKGKKGPKVDKNSPVTPGETTDTDVEEVTAATTEETAVPEEATPVTASEAPEEAGTAGPVAEQTDATATEGEASEEKGA